ncbi:MAG: hypothetical protein ABI461_22535, partial [Polyangiaceae bacterium]
ASAAPVAQSKATGFLSTTVPMAAMPPDFDFGSKKAEYRVYPADNLAARSCATGSANGNPASDVAAIGKACATPTKLHPLGNVLSGTQKADALAQRFPLTAQAGHCYRVYGSAASTITDFSVFILDSAGATAARGHADTTRAAAPPDGMVCFKEADSAVVVVTIGGGEGAFAAQVWSD